jgi:hypothetical protein
MAANATNRLRAWNKAYTHYLTLQDQLNDAAAGEVDAIERALAAAQDKLLGLPAPSFIAVRHKLEILWELDLEKPDLDGGQKALIVEDLVDLIDEAAATLGFGRALAQII